MQTDLSGGPGLAVVAGDVLALRGTGLAAAETWALLCQAAQALQDLFLSNGGVVGGSRAGPVVTPHTLELTPRGRVLLQLAPPETARAYLPPEYRPGRVYSDTDSEKMWMYSLGRALLDTTPRVAALTGTVSVSPSSALQSVLAAMTEPDPRRRASLMNLLDVISEYCRTRLQSKPFTHIVMDMYREVMKSPQYAARKRLAYQHLNPPAPMRNPLEMPEHNIRQGNYPHHHQQHPQQLDPLHAGQAKSVLQYQYQDRPYHMTNQYNAVRQTQQRPSTQFHPHQHHQRLQEPPQLAQPTKVHHYHHHHPAKGALFKLQSRNSHSHPNLPSLCGQQPQNRRQEGHSEDRRTQFQSQLNVQANGRSVGPAIQHQRRHHSRTYSQPIYTRLQHTRSSGNLPSTIGENNSAANVYSDPIYALPVKPFLSSQDVRVNGLSVKPPGGHRNEDVYAATTIARRPSAAGYSHPDIATSSAERGRDEVYGRSTNVTLQRQHSNPQLPSRNQQEDDFKLHSEQNVATADHRCPRGKEEQLIQQQNPVSSIRARSVQGPPKPPRIITTLKKAPFSDAESSKSEPPAKPPRNLVKNGPRARRGKAVQRAPSRLYRTVGGPMRSFNKAQCIGPEFVVRANQPPKTLCVGQAKTGNSGRIVVIMLTGQRMEVTCDPQKVTAGDLFQAIVQAESLDENFTLGLAVLLAGDFAILPPDTKLNKVAPPGWLSSGKSKGLLGLPTSFMLYLRLRFFLPSLRGIRSWISKHLLYLQIRRCILEQQLVCPYHELINLTGLALQAEFGNYNANEHGCGDYFLLEHYIPESLILNMDQHQPQINTGGAEALRTRLHQAHRDRRGLDSNKAEEMFITHAQTLPDYGSHYYIATVDSKELEKVMAQQRRRKSSDDRDIPDGPENIYSQNKQEYPLRGRVEITRLGSCENIPKISYEEKKLGGLMKSATTADIYSAQKSSKCRVESCNNNNVNNVNNNNSLNHGKSGKSGKKKTESNVWLAIHAQGLKLFERGGEPRERIELAQFQWKDIQTLSYSKSCLVVYSKVNGKRCKFKLRMDHRKSYFAFKLTSLHHQFFLRLRSELTSLQGLAKEFGVPTTMEAKPSPSKTKSHDSKTKIAIANTVKNVQLRPSYAMQLEEYQNKENENPQKDTNAIPKTKDTVHEPGIYLSEEDALYAQVNVRLEPEGESRDTEDESERSLTTSNEPLSLDGQGIKNDGKLYNCPRIELDAETECGYSLPKIMSTNDMDQLDKPENPEELYAAINKVGISRKNKFPVPEEVWDVSDVKKSLHKVKTSSLPNYGTPRQTGGYRTPSLPRRLGVKMGTRAIYSSLVQKDTGLTDDMESLSLKSDTESSIQSLSARSTESPPPEAYVLNADIRTDDETFHVPEDESMSASLAARLEELSFAEERILQTIKLERGHGGSIGLQVTEGNDGGVYVQAVSVGGSADMAGNVNKGDRIVAINGQNLLHLRYEDALKMLQSTSDTIELVLSQSTSRKKVTSRQNHQQPADTNYLNDIRFDVSSEADTSSMTNKWLVQRTTDVASVQNTSSAYSSAASSAMGNHNANNLYMADLVDNGALKSANAESTSAPPVPPRRKKRKPKPAAIARSPVSRGTSPSAALRKPDRKRSAPPPPPPRTARRIKSRQSEGRVSNDPETACAEETPNDHVSIIPEETRNNENNSDRVINSPRKSRLVFAKKETNKYPPLFFTLHDFQNVMSSTLQQEEDPPSKSSTEFASALNDSRRQSFENSLDDEENELCFRVTTTNLPFERCLDRWTATFADHFIDKFDESNRFIFEDYIDRSNKVNVRRSAGPMCYDSYEEEPSVPRLTKVRFVIESPSTSTPDEDEELACDSLGNNDPLLGEDVNFCRGSSVRLTEIADDTDCSEGMEDEDRRGSDEFGDVPLASILRTRNDSTEWMSLEDASNIIELTDQESFLECEITRDDSRDSFHSSSSQDLQNDSFLPKLKITEVSKAWLNLIKPKTECTVVLTEIREDCLINRFNDSNEGKNENNNTDEAQSDVEESMMNEMNDNVDREEENVEIGEQKLVTGEIDDFDYRLTVNEVNNDIPKEESVLDEVENEFNEEQKLVTDKIENFDHEVTETDIVKEELVLDEVQNEVKEEPTKNEQIINNQSDKSTTEYRRRIFVNESLRNLMNRPDFSSNDFEEEDSSLEESSENLNQPEEDSQESSNKNPDEVKDNETITKAEIFERRESISVPVDVRRNSFLENMLSKDSDQIWTSCEIVAAHPKTSSLIINEESPSENKIAIRLNDSISKDLEIQQILQESKALLKKVDTSVPKLIRPKMTPPSEEKNPGDIKCNVLNELLSNFNNIKLKPVKKVIVETLPQMTASIHQNEDQQNLETPRNLDNLHGKITKETSDGISDPKPKMLSLEREDEIISSAFKVSNSNDYDNKIQELPRESDTSVSEEDPKKLTRSSEEPIKMSETNLYRAKVIQNEDSSESSKDTSEDRFELQDQQASVESKTEVSANPSKSEKTEVTVHESDDRDRGDEDNMDYNRVERLDLRSRRTFSGDKKSAIVRRTPRTHCNNNDNNRAVTPVAVSDDQSRDTVTITPGRVRSFVRYYEIRRDATDKDSKDRDKLDRDKIAGHRSVVSICRGLEAKAKSSDAKDTLRASMAERNSGSIGCPVNVDRLTDERSVVEELKDDSRIGSSREPRGDSYVQSGKKKRKKSVKFQGGFTVIGTKSPDKDDSSGSRDTRTGRKRAPERPTLKGAVFSGKVDRQDAEELADDDSRIEKRDVAAQIQAAAECKECSGINRFVPKPETPRLVFYCTV